MFGQERLHMGRLATHVFNSLVGIMIIAEGSLYIFINNKDGELHLQSILTTILLLLFWAMSYWKQVRSDNKNAWLIVTMIIMVPLILPWLFFI